VVDQTVVSRAEFQFHFNSPRNLHSQDRRTGWGTWMKGTTPTLSGFHRPSETALFGRAEAHRPSWLGFANSLRKSGPGHHSAHVHGQSSLSLAKSRLSDVSSSCSKSTSLMEQGIFPKHKPRRQGSGHTGMEIKATPASL